MIDFNSPTVLAQSIDAYMACCYVIFGIWFWEFVTTLDFDWEYLTGKRKLKLAAATYFVTRYVHSAVWIIAIRIINVYSSDVNCNGWNLAVSVTAYSSSSLSSLLLLLRVTALSGKNIPLVGFLVAFYLAMWAVMIWGMYSSSAQYLAAFHICAAVNIKKHEHLNTLMIGIFDFMCAGLMMFYLLRGQHRGGHFWKFLMLQGIGYVIAITIAYIITIGFVFANLNDAIAQTANSFGLLTLVINATRMQRHLVRHFEESSVQASSWSGATPTTPSGTMSRPRFATPQQKKSSPGISVDVTTHIDVDHDSGKDGEEGEYPMQKFDRSLHHSNSQDDLGQV